METKATQEETQAIARRVLAREITASEGAAKLGMPNGRYLGAAIAKAKKDAARGASQPAQEPAPVFDMPPAPKVDDGPMDPADFDGDEDGEEIQAISPDYADARRAVSTCAQVTPPEDPVLSAIALLRTVPLGAYLDLPLVAQDHIYGLIEWSRGGAPC